MYTKFFRLNQAPFSIAPDPRYLYMSERHRDALAHLLYGVGGGGGFVVLTGEIGAGKTTVCRCFLEQIPASCNVAYIFNPKLTVPELLQTICDEFGVALPDSLGLPTVKDRVDAFNRFLLNAHAEGRSSVLIIDEAQNLSADVLEQLRLLTNLETNERKLLQIMLIGQPELRTMLARPELEQLAQRVVARYHLGSLSERETARYILHRLAVAGLTTVAPFADKAMRRVHRLTQGVPRRINLLCDRALLGAYATGSQTVECATVNRAAAEVFGSGRAGGRSLRWRHVWLAMLTGSLLAGAAAWTIGRAAIDPSHPGGQFLSKVVATLGFGDQPASGAAHSAASPPTVAVSATADAVAAVDDGRVTPEQTVTQRAADTSTEEHPLPRNEDAALRTLAGLWGEELAAGDVCQAAQAKHLHCFRSNRGLAEIRQLQRPAILKLLDDGGKPYFAMLTGLTNAGVTLTIGNARHTISLLELARRFTGDFATLWRAQPGQRRTLKNGDRGPDVLWLASHLARLNGDKSLAQSQVYDAKLLGAVREFQQVQGLVPDGIVGPKTLMHLNNAAGIKEPRLLNAPVDTPPVTASITR